jgi:extracellular factor (EF) 3-hydroxypalmitic acid methyl ester biosynthesis protein
VLVPRMNAASQALGPLVMNVPPSDQALYRAFARRHLQPLLSQSPILRRTCEKPLGYPGDYEVMNMFYRNHAEGDSLFGKLLNIYAAQEPAAQATVNRLEYIQSKIRAAMPATGQERLRVASIGCGPAHELRRLLERWPDLGARLEVALIDQEDRALTYCERMLAPIAARTNARVHVIRESVRRLLGTQKLSETLGSRDLIYSAGLFDYFSDRSFAVLLAALYEALTPGGQLLVGNMSIDNPTRWFMEYCLDWFLIHRSEQDLLALASALRPRPAQVHVEAESSGVNLFLAVTR